MFWYARKLLSRKSLALRNSRIESVRDRGGQITEKASRIRKEEKKELEMKRKNEEEKVVAKNKLRLGVGRLTLKRF